MRKLTISPPDHKSYIVNTMDDEQFHITILFSMNVIDTSKPIVNVVKIIADKKSRINTVASGFQAYKPFIKSSGYINQNGEE